MHQLKDINGRLRTCTRCNSGDPAVFKKSGEWLCEKCLKRRKERQAATAALPKCHKCNAPAMYGLPYCNNHVPTVDPLHELECRVARLEQQLAEARQEAAIECLEIINFGINEQPLMKGEVFAKWLIRNIKAKFKLDGKI